MTLSELCKNILGWLRWRFGPEFDETSRDGYLYDPDPNKTSIVIRLGGNYPTDRERVVRPAIYVMPSSMGATKPGVPMNSTYKVEEITSVGGAQAVMSHHYVLWRAEMMLRCEALAPIEALRIAERCAMSIVELNHLFSQWLGVTDVSNVGLSAPQHEKQEDDVWPTDVRFDIVWENSWRVVHPPATPFDATRRISVSASTG